MATKITGHRSESMYRRYTITTPENTRPALGKVAALIGYSLGVAETVKQALIEEPQAVTGTIAGAIPSSAVEGPRENQGLHAATERCIIPAASRGSL